MKRQTIVEKLTYLLKVKGWKQVPNAISGRYATFSHPNVSWYYFMGVRGSLRKGTCVTKSRNAFGWCTTPNHKQVDEAIAKAEKEI